MNTESMRKVPDAIHHTDPAESLEYITGWNDCRQAMLAEQPAQQEPVGYVCFEGDEVVWTGDPPESGTLLYTTPQAQENQS